MREILKEVSRSFYLTLRVLPAPVAAQIGLAYLLARATDTIADTRLIAGDKRLAVLQKMRAAICAAADQREAEIPDFGESADAQELPAGREFDAESDLLKNIARLLQWLRIQTPADRILIRDLLEIISRGQEMDLSRFTGIPDGSIAALANEAELEQYTYSVAGCVGEFWTRICRAHLFPRAQLDDLWLLSRAVRFGKGLQLTNILRDLPGDLRNGRCYIPRTRLGEYQLQPETLLSPSAIDRFRPLLEDYIAQAEQDLAAGWEYTLALPWSSARVRLACAWPILIGIRTLAHLRSANVLDAQNPIKIARPEVHSLIWSSLIRYPSPAAWRYLFRIAGRKQK
jgi:farnesyl-diphosphate farnesyltransferase